MTFSTQNNKFRNNHVTEKKKKKKKKKLGFHYVSSTYITFRKGMNSAPIMGYLRIS